MIIKINASAGSLILIAELCCVIFFFFLIRGEDVREGIKASKSWLEVLQMVVENVREHQENG